MDGKILKKTSKNCWQIHCCFSEQNGKCITVRDVPMKYQPKKLAFSICEEVPELDVKFLIEKLEKINLTHQHPNDFFFVGKGKKIVVTYYEFKQII